eukprot:1159831-Pelagomonas_calceolata.AAC.18
MEVQQQAANTHLDGALPPAPLLPIRSWFGRFGAFVLDLWVHGAARRMEKQVLIRVRKEQQC